MKHPDPMRGMSANEAFQDLRDMEDLILGGENETIRYIARQTGAGRCKFYFYASPDLDFSSFMRKIHKAFPEYEIFTFDFEDADWHIYFENLYPNRMGMNEILNRSVYENLEENGDDLDIPRTIDHTIIFRTRDQASEFSKVVERIGFTVKLDARGTGSGTYDLLVQRVDQPSELDPITYE
ncbi:DUF695 domain-containing protein, partial [Thioclava sp. BHET1]